MFGRVRLAIKTKITAIVSTAGKNREELYVTGIFENLSACFLEIGEADVKNPADVRIFPWGGGGGGGKKIYKIKHQVSRKKNGFKRVYCKHLLKTFVKR